MDRSSVEKPGHIVKPQHLIRQDRNRQARKIIGNKPIYYLSDVSNAELTEEEEKIRIPCRWIHIVLAQEARPSEGHEAT